MSDKTLFNQNLTLKDLTINNNQYVGTSGFVPSSASITSSKTGVSINASLIDASGAVIGVNTLNGNGITTIKNIFICGGNENGTNGTNGTPYFKLSFFSNEK